MRNRILNRKWIIGALILIVFGAGYLLFPGLYETVWGMVTGFFRNPERFRNTVLEMGAGGYLFIIAIQIIQIVLFPLPGQVSTILAGVFGTSWGLIPGILITMAGLTAGSVLAFLIGRYFFRDWVARKLEGKKAWQTFSKLSSGKGLWIIGLIYIVPGLPNDFMCYILGLSKAPLSKFILVTTVCRVPNVIITFLLGYFAGFSRWWLVALIGTAVFIITLFAYLKRSRIEEWIQSRIN